MSLRPPEVRLRRAVEAVELPAETDVRVELDLAPGTYRYFCDVRGHEDMQGALIVR